MRQKSFLAKAAKGYADADGREGLIDVESNSFAKTLRGLLLRGLCGLRVSFF